MENIKRVYRGKELKFFKDEEGKWIEGISFFKIFNKDVYDWGNRRRTQTIVKRLQKALPGKEFTKHGKNKKGEQTIFLNEKLFNSIGDYLDGITLSSFMLGSFETINEVKEVKVDKVDVLPVWTGVESEEEFDKKELDLKLNENKKVSTLQVLEEINFFRKQEGKNEKLHKNLLRDLKDEFDEEINQLKIEPVTYKDKKGENRTMYELTINEAKQLLVRESKLVRKAVIKRLDELENKVKENGAKVPTTMLEVAEMLVASEKEKLKLLERNKEVEDEFGKLIHQTRKLYRVTEIAVETGIGSAITLNRLLKQLNVQRRVNNTWVLKAKYKDMDFVSLKVVRGMYYNDGSPLYDMKWTEKGKLFIINLLKENKLI